MTTNEIILSVIIAVLVIILVTLLTTQSIKKKKNKKIMAARSKVVPMNIDFANSLAILEMVSMECIENRKFSLKINEKTSLPPLDDEIKFMVEKVMVSIGDPLMFELLKYVSRKFIIRYVTRLVRDYCIDYIEEIRFKKNKR